MIFYYRLALLAATLTAALAAATPTASPLAVTVLRPERGPEVLVHRQALPAVALRLSAPVAADLPEGTVELLLELARPTASAAADSFGARLELRHEGGFAVIAVSGPARAFDAMVHILRQATAAPDLSTASLAIARARAEGRVLSELEQPGPRLQRLLWQRLQDGPAPVGAAAVLLPPESLRALRARLFDPSALRVAMVGDIPPEAIRAAFTGWEAAGAGPRAARDTVPEAARPELHHDWAAIAYRLEADPAVLAVAAELVDRRIRAAGLRSGSAQAWGGPGGPALVLLGAAAPADTAVMAVAQISEIPAGADAAAERPSPVARYLRRTIAEAASLAGPATVADAASQLRYHLLMEARSPGGKAEVIGRMADLSGRPDGADAFLAGLETATIEMVREALAAALAAPPVLIEARP